MDRLSTHFFSRAFFLKLKEHILQLLFPRVCPLCGEVLRLPSGWAQFLTDASFSGVPSEKEIAHYRAALICNECQSRITYATPPSCICCGRPLDAEEASLCELCKKKRPAFDRGAALLVHDAAAKKIIYDLKFHNRRDNADWIGFEMALHLAESIRKWQVQVLLPVPLHKKRFRERGFNQAERIAASFSFCLEKLYQIRVPVCTTCLLRSANTKPQRVLDAGSRTLNVGHAFAVSPDAGRFRSVLLIDDICTTGATLDACAKALKHAGVKNVYFLAASIV